MSGIELRRTPRWLWAIIAALACLQPAAHLICMYAPPEGMVPTGLHIPDSALFIQSMDMLQTGFHSPYASAQAVHGPNHWTHFAIPHLWLYAIEGQIADLIGMDHFLFYGLFNGIVAAIFLWSIYRFFVAAAPGLANRAFILFALGGGFGGIIWIVTLGLQSATHYEDYVWRFVIYELVEGAHLFPATYYARSYYTLSLAGCFGALTVFIHALQIRCPRHTVLAGIILLPAAFLNARYGVFTIAVALLIFSQHRKTFAPPHYLATLSIFGLIGVACSYTLMSFGPYMLQNHRDVGDMQMHFSPFIVSVVLLGASAFATIRKRCDSPNPLFRTAIWCGIGYLAAFTVLFIAYQTYMGNILIAHDAAVAVAISDWALLGALAGAVIGYRRTPTTESTDDWMLVWFLGFLCLSISAFGQGWFLSFGPQRLMPMVFIALCLVAAATIQRRTIAVVATCGVVSILVSTFLFQSSLGWRGHDAPFAETHYSVMNKDDEKLLEALAEANPERVIAYGPIVDVIALRDIASVVHGVGSFNMSDQRFIETRETQRKFFDPDTMPEARIDMCESLQISHIVISSTWPPAAETIRAIRYELVFERVYRYDDATIYFTNWRKNSAEPILDYVTDEAAP